jgi:drug/metabolite transporter (DMT)-like permease
MILGAFVGGWGDLHADALGYLLTLLNCLVTALYLVYIPKKTRETNLNNWGLMFYNNLLSLPTILLLVAFLEWEKLATFEHWRNPGFQVRRISTCGCVFALFLDLCVRVRVLHQDLCLVPS